jgi:hypothetical protein
MKPLTHNRLKELLSYDCDTGVFRWRCNRGGTARAGSVAGNLRDFDGYIQIKIDRRLYLAHVLAMLWINGTWPSEDVDHINGIRSDNRLTNLRTATTAQNVFNQGMRSDNKSGMKGVCWLKKNRKWRAQIQANGRKYHVGLFDSVQDAARAYDAKAVEIFGQFKRAC